VFIREKSFGGTLQKDAQKAFDGNTKVIKTMKTMSRESLCDCPKEKGVRWC
jgi:hypothetical protein